MRAATKLCSTLLPGLLRVEFEDLPEVRSVSKGPGRRLLIVTLCCTVVRERPAMKPVRPVRAPFERPELRDRRLHRARGDVDHAAEAARDHAVDRRRDQEDRRDHVRVDRLQPGFAVPVAKIARRRAAGVVHQDVGRRARLECGRAAFAVVMSPATVFTSTLKRLRISAAVVSSASCPARGDDQVHAFARERNRAALAETLRCRATSAVLPRIPRSIL